MSDAAISDTSETLLEILRQQLSGLVERDHVVLASPADVQLDTSPWLAVFLYQVAENPHLRNQEMTRPDPRQLAFPPTEVDLNYLMVPYAGSREDEQKILGRVIQAFAGRPVLRGSVLLRSLAGQDIELRVVPHALSTDELSRLWNAFPDKPFKVSLGYQVTPVRISSSRAPLDIQPVVERELTISTG